jgi:hypothetical protein
MIRLLSSKWPFHIDKSNDNNGYDMVIGSNILNDLGLTLDYENKIVK